MAYTFTLTATLPAAPQDIYEAWLDSIAHSAMTGGEANMSAEVGAEVSAWDGYITGRNLELIPGQRIVQSWRTSEFDAEDEDSIVTIALQEIDDGTLLTLQHSNVPEAHRSYEEGGWQSNYFEPMTVYFVQQQRVSRERKARPPRKEAARTPTPRRAAKRAPPRLRKASLAKRKEKTQKKAKAVRMAAATGKRAKQRPKARRRKQK